MSNNSILDHSVAGLMAEDWIENHESGSKNLFLGPLEMSLKNSGSLHVNSLFRKWNFFKCQHNVNFDIFQVYTSYQAQIAFDFDLNV